MNRNSDNIVYLIEKMENAQNLQYNPNKTFHENLQEHQDGKKLLEEANNQNFLKAEAVERTTKEKEFQSDYWRGLRRGEKAEDAVWLPQ